MRRKALSVGLLSAAAMVISGMLFCALGQEIKAMQGVSSNHTTEFASPMVLDVSLDRLRTEPDQSLHFEPNDYVCDDVVITALDVVLRPSPDKQEARLQTYVEVYTRRSFDRVAQLSFELVKGEQAIASWKVNDIDAESNKMRYARKKSPLFKSDDVLWADPPPHLKITVTVRR
jgi:hypothetical protein